LRTSIEDGSIEGLVQWHHVQKGDVIFVPAGTIHAIGAGLVIAEIQQRSDATFRLFDHGRGRELHVDNAVAVANAGPAGRQSAPQHLTDTRTLLVASPHFVLEQIDFSPKSTWELRADSETWLLVLEGHARIGSIKAFIGEAIFVKADHTSINVGSDGLTGLLAYAAVEPCPGLLHNLDGPNAGIPIPHFPRLPFHDRASEARP
jgi:mannose-6-phosphate isomerase